MAKIHHSIPVGMYAVNGVRDNAASAPMQLLEQLKRIYEGDPASPYQACNVVQSYSAAGLWGGGEAEGTGRVQHNANGWRIFLEQIQTANAFFGGGNLKGIVSRNLAALRQGTANTNPGPWSPEELFNFADSLCAQIISGSLQDCVGGWYLSDEGLGRDWYFDPSEHEWKPGLYSVSDDSWREAVTQVHRAQIGRGLNYPFYWADTGERWKVEENIPWPLNTWHIADNQWYYTLPDRMISWVDIVFELDDAEFVHSEAEKPRLIYQPFYYPWGSSGQDWRYRKHARSSGELNTVLPDNPPWSKWYTFMEALRTTFPVNEEHPGYARLFFQPVAQTSLQTEGSLYPRHVDIHKQIRVLLNLRAYWQELGDQRFNGIWFLGWNMTGYPNGDSAAWTQWEQAGTYRYAEAIQNEFGAGTEGITDAWKEGSGNITSRIVSVEADPEPRTTAGFFIHYHLAPSSFLGSSFVLGPNRKMGTRNAFRIEIWRKEGGIWITDPPVATIDEGYTYHGGNTTSISPQGKYVGSPMEQGSETLIGTAAYWDGQWDNGPHDGEDVDVTIFGEDYAAVLFFADVQQESLYPFEKLQSP
jgi:hypothetical protein